MCRSARLYNCVLCHRQVIICSHCDHGNSYCSGKCSAQSRLEKQREASDRYQSSSRGRHLHALRQRHYRQRKKEKVTYAVSPGRDDSLQKAQGCCQSEVRDSARGRLKFYPE